MADIPLIGRTAKIEYKVGGGSFVLIAKPFMITAPSPECGDIDWSNLASPGRSREFVPGLIDYGTCSFEALYTQANLALLDELANDTDGTNATQFKVTGPDPVGSDPAKSFTFSGYLKKFEIGTFSSDEEVVKVKGEIKVTGEITLA